MDTDAEIQDLEERVLGTFEEAMDIAYREGVRDALDAAGLIAFAVEPDDVPEVEYDDLLAALDEIGDPEICPCGCGFTYDEIYQDDAPYAEPGDEEPEMINDIPGFSDLSDRLEAVEEYVGLKYTG